jgi:hypothetical protein
VVEEGTIDQKMLIYLKGIKNLLYNDGYTIRGVQKVIKENGSKNILFSNNNVNLKAETKNLYR